MNRLPQDLAPATVLRLVLGDQLDPLHPWFEAGPDPAVLVVLMEIRQETDYTRHHAQKVLAIFAAMRRFAHQLREAGHRVHYLRLGNPHNRQSLTANLDALAQATGATTVEVQLPDEWRLDAQLRAHTAQAPYTLCRVDSRHFLSARDEAARFFGDGPWLMERFYRHLRQREQVLMEGRQPAGGRWNFDTENRRRWPGDPPEPPDTRRRHDHRALWAEIEAAGVATMGEPSAEALPWPLDRAEALADLQSFIAHGLPHFGPFQDALSDGHERLFHSLLSFALNTKMLHPREVIAAAEAAWREGRAPLPSVEGFIRQILGWREYVRGVYWARMPGYVALNHLGHERPLPAWFWTGETRMRCLQRALGQSLQQAHAHHIQRLMVIGNFALLAGLHPAEVHQWYLGVYIDAFEWVEAPNTLGMSQFADGGGITTKPYVSSAAYLDRMGDHCRHCPYDKRQRLGERACPFNALYWDFMDRHAEKLRHLPRLAPVYRQLERMSEPDRLALREQARAHLERLDRL
jgi:deoxyribodipyrimidine photolyase-related protein